MLYEGRWRIDAEEFYNVKPDGQFWKKFGDTVR